MSEYIIPDDLVSRLTQVGMLYLFDKNKDGVVDQTEITLYLQPAIVYGGNVVDGYICEQLVTGSARGAQNPWLKDRCIDVATHRACSTGGKAIPESIKDSLTETLRLLAKVQGGWRIPGYPYPGPVNAWYPNHTPKVANFGGGNGVRRGRIR